METRELKEWIGSELGGRGWINGQQEMKTGWKDRVGVRGREGHGSQRERREGGEGRVSLKKRGQQCAREEEGLGGERAGVGNGGGKGCEGSVCVSVCVRNCRSLC